MRFHHRSRRVPAARHLFAVLSASTLATVAASAADGVVGHVLDQSGRPVPRAIVRVTDGTHVQASVADESGTFELTTGNISSCRVVATLAGFEQASAPCEPSGT